jgi:hypothetical protein
LYRTMAALSVPLSLLGALFQNKLWMEGSSRGVVFHLSRLQMSSPGSMVHRHPGDGRARMDSCRVEALSKVVVASVADLTRAMYLCPRVGSVVQQR